MNSLVLFVTIVVNLGLAFYIYLKDKENEINRVFGAILFLAAFWSASFLFFTLNSSSLWALFWRRMTPVGSSLLAGYFLYFTLIFPKRKIKQELFLRLKKIFCLLPGYLFALTSLFTPWMIRAFDSGRPDFGPAYYVYAFYLIAYFLGAILNLWYQYLRGSGREKLQVFYVLTGMSLAIIGGVIVSLLLPIFGWGRFFSIGPPFTLIMVAFVTYAIVRHRLLNIEDFFSWAVFSFSAAIALVGTLALLLFDSAGFLITFYVILANLTLGLFVYLQNRKNPTSIGFFLLAASIAFWSLSAFMVRDRVVSGVFFWDNFIFVWSTLIPLFFLLFAFVFPRARGRFLGGYRAVFIVPAIFFLILNQAGLIIQNVLVGPAGAAPQFGPAYPFFMLYFLVYIIWGLVILIRKYSVSSGQEKVQIRFLFGGLLLTFFFAILTNLILPVFGEIRFFDLGPVFTLFAVVFTTYAIIRHRLMSVELVIQRGFVYTVASVLIIGLYALAVYLSEQFLQKTFGYSSVLATAFLVFIIAALFQPLLRFLQDATDNIFMRHKYDYQKSLRNLSRDILKMIRLDEIAGLIVSTFVDTMQVSEISFLVFDEKKASFKAVELSSVAPHGRYKKFKLGASGNLAKCLLATKRILSMDELEEEILKQEAEEGTGALRWDYLMRVHKESESWGFKLWLPVVSKDKLLAIIALGEKLSGDPFTAEDMRILNTLANQTALALENVHLYREVILMRNYNQEILDSLIFGVLTSDEKGVIRTCNPAMEKIIGIGSSEIVGRPFKEVFSEKNPLRVSILSTLENKCLFNFEASVLNKKRGLVPVMINTTLLGNPQDKTGVLLAVRDLTEIKELENRIRQADKLKALGTMSAGMAHEIKNPLSSLRVLAQLLPIKYDDPVFRGKLLEIIPDEVGRIDRIVESLLRFAKTTKMKFSKVNINDYLDNILKDYLRQAEENGVKAVKNYAKLPEIMIDPDQFFQVFSNLFLNGIQAMPEGGELNITTKIGRQVGEFIQGVMIEISDTGHGISDEDLKSLFDPFFTTKHGGTGLGLTIAHSIVEAHQGEIKVTSKLGEGTVFNIYLPVQQ